VLLLSVLLRVVDGQTPAASFIAPVAHVSHVAALHTQECKDENYDFIRKVFLKSGISQHGSYLPAWINPVLTKEPKYDMATAKLEAEMTMCGAMADLLDKTGEHAARQQQQCCCCCFCTVSMAAAHGKQSWQC
jgi:hypothetical protein